MTVIDEYLKKIEPSKRKELERIRKIGKEIVPTAIDSISYGMPTLKYKGKAFLGFDIHTNHIGIYPFGGEEIEVFKNQIVKLGFSFTKGSIHVPFDKPIPKSLLVDIINHRIKRLK